MSKESIGILLTNLGTPDAPTKAALRRYLAEFLWDPRVIDLNRALWWCILHGIVLRSRPARSAKLYQNIWTDEGSPLLSISRSQLQKLQEKITIPGRTDELHFALGMRYGNPSIAQAMNELRTKQCKKIIVLPMYPQYSAATTGSTFDAFFSELKSWREIPEVALLQNYHDHPGYIAALVASIRTLWQEGGEPERLLFSFHGLPQRYVQLGDPYYQQCLHTAELVVRELKLNPARFMVAFQSRFGREPWLQPYTDVTLAAWAKSGTKHVDVICPGFSADCLETLEEIDMQYRQLFLNCGGQKFRYIPALNDSPTHIQALAELLQPYLTLPTRQTNLQVIRHKEVTI